MDLPSVIAIEDVTQETGTDAHGNCLKAVLHRTSAAETSLFTVKPSEVLAAHIHPLTWDLFFGIAGRGEIAYHSEQGTGLARLNPHSFCAMPPGCRHEVRNLSATEALQFLLIHAPWDGYQFVRSGSTEPA